MKTLIPLLFILQVFCTCKQSVYQGGCDENPKYKNRLFVFIGEKINIEQLDVEKGSMNAKFKATYKVIEPVCGNYDRDTIQFIVYDHYGRPGFEDYKNAMLFVTNYDDTFYHEKYQYFNVYKTRSGEWASSYQYDDYKRLDSNNHIKPEKIDFLQPPAYNVKYMSKKIIEREYPSPYYKIIGDSAIAVWGNYIDELLELKKKGVLAARKIFGDTSTSDLLVQDVKLANIFLYDISPKDSIELIMSFKRLIHTLKENNIVALKKMSLNKIDCSICEGFPVYGYVNEMESIDDLISASKLLPGSTLWDAINKSNTYDISATTNEDDVPENYTLSADEKFVIYEIYFRVKVQFPNYSTSQEHRFEFVKINDEFKFYGIHSN